MWYHLVSPPDLQTKWVSCFGSPQSQSLVSFPKYSRDHPSVIGAFPEDPWSLVPNQGVSILQLWVSNFLCLMFLSKHCLSGNIFSGPPVLKFLSTWTCSQMPPAEQQGKHETTLDNYWMMNLAIRKASEMKYWDIREFTEKPSTTFLTCGIVPHHIP